ncbi:MAG: hypothetical protein NTV55_11240 [Planctomycetota bacterium]|nr:hypothetical protein [Planctomycetota bacterium]RLS37000.1 MAG: hypothetical protein DWH82_11825 [Planctomycetota bacterium]
MLSLLLAILPLPAAPADEGKPVKFQILSSYFVKNTTPIPPDGQAIFRLKNLEAFDEIFQQVPPFGLRRPGGGKPVQPATVPLPSQAFPSHEVLAVAIESGSSAQYSKVQVTRLDDIIQIRFHSSAKPGRRDPNQPDQAVFVSPLILLVPAVALEGARQAEFLREGGTPTRLPLR